MILLKLLKNELGLIILLLLSVSIKPIFAQCPVRASANVTTILCGDTVKLNAIAADGDYLIDVDFNTSANQPGPYWSIIPPVTYNNPCGPGIDSTPYFWIEGEGGVVRELVSNYLDLTEGGYIRFDMRYGIHETTGECEGPDLPEEGVYLQYRTGTDPWINIDYWHPKGGKDTLRTNWKTYQYTLPAGACKWNTQLRWKQISLSGSGFGDYWGLDNILVVRNNPNYRFYWPHDNSPPSVTGAIPDVSPYSDTTYTVRYYHSTDSLNIHCTDSVNIRVIKPSGTITASPVQVCANGESQLDITTSLVPPTPQICGISPTGCMGISNIVDIGTGTVNGGLDDYFPFGKPLVNVVSSCGCTGGLNRCAKSSRTQMIIRASELPSYFKGGQIYSIIFDILSASGGFPANSNFQEFTILMNCTDKTEFSSNTDFIGGLVTVFGPKTINIMNNSKNTFIFDNSFDWDGTSNVVIQFCWKSTDFKTGNMNKTSTGYYSAIHAQSCGTLGCSETVNATRFRLRPSMRLGICHRPIPEISYAWAPGTGLSDSNIRTPLATVSKTTSYTVLVSDTSRPMCTVSKSVTVKTVRPGLSILPASANICSSTSDSVQLMANVNPSIFGTSIISYSWSPSSGLTNPNVFNPKAFPATSTTYTVTVTDDGGCSSIDSVTVNVRPLPAATVSGTDTTCPGVTKPISIELTGTPPWSVTFGNEKSSNEVTNIFSSPYILTTSVSGTYTLSAISDKYCSGTSSGNYSIFVNPPIVTSNLVVTCDGSNSSYTVSFEISGGDSLTYSITGNSGTLITGPVYLFTSDPITSGLPYSFTVTDKYNCSVMQVEGIKTCNCSVEAVISGGGIICDGDSTEISIDLAGDPDWDFTYAINGVNQPPVKGQHTTPYTFNTSIPGAYSISQINDGNCNGLGKGNAAVSIKSLPSSSISVDKNLCDGGSSTLTIDLSGEAPWNFSYSDGNSQTNIINQNFSPFIITTSVPGNYIVTEISDQNCQGASNGSATLTINPKPVIAKQNNISVCSGGLISPDIFMSIPEGVVYTWINDNTQIGIGSSGTGNISPYYAPYNNSGSDIKGNITVTPTIDGCSGSAMEFSITILPAPEILNSLLIQTLCSGGDTAIFTPIANVPGTVFNWTASVTSGSVTGVSPAGTGDITEVLKNTGTTIATVIYVVTPTAPNECSGNPVSFVVSIIPIVTVEVPESISTCHNAIVASTDLNSEPPGAIYYWMNSDTAIGLPGSGTGNIPSFTASYSPPSTEGEIVVTPVLNGCQGISANYSIIVKPSPVLSITHPAGVCQPGTVDITGAAITVGSTGDGTLSYWKDPFVTIVLDSPNAVGISGSYFIMSTTVDGCLDIEPVNVSILPKDNASFSYPSRNYCKTGSNPSPIITGLSYGTFKSSSEIDINANTGLINLSESNTGTHTVIYTTNGACPDSNTFDIEITPAPKANFSYDGPYCIAETPYPIPIFPAGAIAGNFSATPKGISFTNNIPGEIDLAESASGTYNIKNTIAATKGCSADSAETTLTIHPNPHAGFNWNPQHLTMESPIAVFNSVSSPDVTFWKWDFSGLKSSSSESPYFVFPAAGSYNIELVVSNGFCFDSTVNNINILEDDITFYIPNAFTPDGDGLNDSFGPKGIELKNNYQMFIFNRWGELVYETEDINKPWYGMLKNESEPAIAGVYIYHIIVIDDRNEKHYYEGDIRLLR